MIKNPIPPGAFRNPNLASSPDDLDVVIPDDAFVGDSGVLDPEVMDPDDASQKD